MTLVEHRNGVIIALAFVLALGLTVMPLPI